VSDLRLDFDDAEHLLRGSLHCHSDRSDGACSPEAVLAAYRGAGYDFVAITDHLEPEYGFRVADTPSTVPDGLIAISAAELSTGEWSHRDTFWVAAVGLPAGFELDAAARPIGRLEEARAAGAWIVLLHPRLNHWDPAPRGARQPEVELVDAVEVYTHSLAATWPDQAHGSAALDALLESGRRVGAVAADDAHFVHRKDRFGAWVMASAERPDEEGVMAALRDGRYFSTQGPRLDGLVLDGHRLDVRVRDVYAVCVTGAGDRWRSAQQRFLAEGDAAADFDVGDFAGSYCRVTVVDEHGRRAWSNPLWV
jgi:hypothetical protein